MLGGETPGPEQLADILEPPAPAAPPPAKWVGKGVLIGVVIGALAVGALAAALLVKG